MDFGQVTLEPFTASIQAERCSGCLVCVNTCPYQAIEAVQLNGHQVAHVNEIICKGCGTCVAACPSGAARQLGFTSEQVMAEISAILEQNIFQEVAN